MNDFLGLLLVAALFNLGYGVFVLATAVERLRREGLAIRGPVLHEISHTIEEPKEPWQGGEDPHP